MITIENTSKKSTDNENMVINVSGNTLLKLSYSN